MSEFFGSDIPQYAILSHTWKKYGEVTHQQWNNRRNKSVTKKPGYRKIIGACMKARSHDIKWLWVDTNCIDKTSSAEVSEAINSMFTWYHDAVECYVYMADVHLPKDSDVKKHPNFRESKWFSRGWTLQELLAPKKVIFYSRDWVNLGSRDSSLLEAISEVTGIECKALSSIEEMSGSSVAAKMSWLSRRRTTREEDMAYCMLGIFDLNMPLLYGEGRKAFSRLQEEILRTSSDHSIFAWTWNDDVPSEWTSILAPSPSNFRRAANLVQTPTTMTTPYSITNVGLSIELPLAYSFRSDWVLLDVTTSVDSDRWACIALSKGGGYSADIYQRHSVSARPILLPPNCFNKRLGLYLEARPSRLMTKTDAVSHDSQLGASGLNFLETHFLRPQSRCAFFGLLFFLEEEDHNSTLFTMPEDVMDDSGVLRFGHSDEADLTSVLIYTNNRECIYVGVRRAQKGTALSGGPYNWYLTSWREPFSRVSMQHRLDEINSVVRRLPNLNQDSVLLKEGFKIFEDFGEAANLGTVAEGRVVSLGKDFQPLPVHTNRLGH